jgi:alpha-L-fucosidase
MNKDMGTSGQGETASPMADSTNPDVTWRRLKFGLMMHWGMYSVAGGVWQGRNIEGYNEQIMHRARIPWPEYLTLLDGFTAERWAPDAVARLAAEAGMKYVVITTKHHDGFNLWHTKLSGFNAVDATPARRDVLKALSDACERQAMAFGIYYSLIDWHYPGAAPMSDNNSDAITPALELYTVGQLRELLTGYGPLCEIWFDMGMPTPEQSRRFADLVHQLQPACRVSGRVWNGCDDFMECGDNETPNFWFEGAWESSVTMFHDTWGYRSWQERGSVEAKIREKIRDVAFVTARGGNYLLNIGPRGDGSIHEFDAAVLKGIGRWMNIHGEAVYDGAPQPHLPLEFGYATGRPGRLYLYVATPPADGVLRVPGWCAPGPVASLLARPASIALACASVGGTLEITLPASGLDPDLPVVAIDYSGAQPYVPRDALAIKGGETLTLAVGAALPWHRMQGHDYYSQKKFVVAREWLLWPETAVRGKIIAHRPAGGPIAGFRLSAAGQETQFILPESGEAQSHECLELSLPPGCLATVTLRHIAPRLELRDEGLVVEFQPHKPR